MRRMRTPAIIRLVAALTVIVTAPVVMAASRENLDRDAARALRNLYAGNSAAQLLGKKAKAILVFPSIVKAGFARLIRA